MLSFSCKTRDASGRIVEKTIEADSEREALMRLEEDGLFPIKIKKAGAAGRGRSLSSIRSVSVSGVKGRRVKPKELLQFTHQLASSIEAGVPLLGALHSIQSQVQERALGPVIAQMVVDIEGGLPLSGALERHPRAFPESYVSTVAAGEASGGLDEVLNNLADHLEAKIEVSSDVRSALMYPAIVMVTLGLAVSVLIIFVVPKFASFYSGFGSELPLPTRVLISTSTTLSQHFPVVLLGCAALAFGTLRLIKTAGGKAACESVLTRVPIVGKLLETAVTLQAAQLIGLFTRAGIPLLQGLEMTATATTHTAMRKKLLGVAEGIAAGGTLTNSMESAQCFQHTARQMISTGETTGSLDRACFAVAKQYKKELHYLTKNLAVMIEPMLTLVLAAVVLFVALATFLPMWDLVKIVG